MPSSSWCRFVAGAAVAFTALLPIQQQMRRRSLAQCDDTGGMAAFPEVVSQIPSGLLLNRSNVSLYQYESCPFCRKVRSCLDYHKVPYTIVEVHPLNKKEAKEISDDYKKVPVLRIDDPAGRSIQLRDSKAIVISLLVTAGAGNPGVAAGTQAPTATASTGKMIAAPHALDGVMWADQDQARSVEEQWLRWTDLVLVQCIVLNVYRSLDESAETFSYLFTHPSFTWFMSRSAAWAGTGVMWAVAKSRKRSFEVGDERAALGEAVDQFARAVHLGGGQFLGGSRPGAVDFNVYGILKSTEGCTTERFIFEHCKSIAPWYAAMSETVGPSCAQNRGDVKRGS